MKHSLLILLSFFSFQAFSQFNSEFLKYSDHREHVSVYADVEFNSNCITNKFLQRFYFGGHIDSSIKKSVSDRMLNNNYAGGLASFGMNAFFGKDSSRFSWFVGAKHQEIMNASFSRDFFNCIFYGNQMYKGKRADFYKTGLNYLRFQELKMGFVWRDVDTVGKIGGALSVLNGQSLLQFRTNDTNYLFTAEDATQLDYNANFTLTMSDTGNTSLAAMNGIGLSADLYVETPYKSVLGPSKFIITVNNLGFIKWNKRTMEYTVDSLFTFSGFNVDNLLDLEDSTLNAISRDSILNNSTELRTTTVNTNLPMNFILIHQVDFTKKYSLRVGVRNIFNGNYKPYFFIDNRYHFSRNFYLGALVSYGGYGLFSGGLYAEYSVKDQWCFKAGSNAVQGFVLPQKTLGQSVYITLSKKFK
jgi:hypothetical protein